MSTPSPRMFRSESVTRAAISISASFFRSSPVISQSIHTSLSFIRRMLVAALTAPRDDARAFGGADACCGPAVVRLPVRPDGHSRRPPGRRTTDDRARRSGAARRRPTGARGRDHRRDATDRRRLPQRGRRGHARRGGACRGRSDPARAGRHPAGHVQPARPGGRRDRYRQDQDAAGDRRAAVGGGRPGVHARRQGRPDRSRRCAGTGNDRITARAAETGDNWAGRRLSGGVPVDRRAGHRDPDPGEHRQLRADPAVEGARPERHPGVDARADLPLGRRQEPAAAGPQGSAGGHRAPDQRGGQGRPRRAGRGVEGDRGGHPAGAGQPGGRRRRRLLRRAAAATWPT